MGKEIILDSKGMEIKVTLEGEAEERFKEYHTLKNGAKTFLKEFIEILEEGGEHQEIKTGTRILLKEFIKTLQEEDISFLQDMRELCPEIQEIDWDFWESLKRPCRAAPIEFPVVRNSIKEK